MTRIRTIGKFALFGLAVPKNGILKSRIPVAQAAPWASISILWLGNR